MFFTFYYPFESRTWTGLQSSIWESTESTVLAWFSLFCRFIEYHALYGNHPWIHVANVGSIRRKERARHSWPTRASIEGASAKHKPSGYRPCVIFCCCWPKRPLWLARLHFPVLSPFKTWSHSWTSLIVICFSADRQSEVQCSRRLLLASFTTTTRFVNGERFWIIISGAWIIRLRKRY